MQILHIITLNCYLIMLKINMNTKLITLVFLLAVTLTDKPKIRVLTQKNMEHFAKDNSYWLVQISNGKCPECSTHQAELQQLAYMFEGVLKVGKIDSKLIPSLKIDKNPSYMFTRSDEPQHSTPFQGSFVRKDIAKFCLEQLANHVKKRAASQPKGEDKGSKSSASSSQGKSKSKSSGGSSGQSSRSSSSVVELNDKQFEDKVLKSSDAWLVQFYSPGCGHCRNFEPEYNKLPGLIGKRVHISRIDGSQNQKYMGQYQVKGFPTVLLFDTQNKDKPITYEGQRTAQAVADWLKGQNINEQKQELLELNKANYNKECGRNIVCLIFILNKKSQKSKLKFLQEVMNQNMDKPFRFFYSQRLPQFESDLMIDDRDCPKLVSVWESLNSYRIYNGQMQEEAIGQYLKTILERRGWIKFHQGKFSNAFFPIASTDL